MRLDVHVEGLGLELRVGRVVDARDRLRGREVVQVGRQLGELGARALLLPFLFVLGYLLVVLVQVAPHLLVLRLHVLQVLLARVEVVLVLPAVEAPVATQTRVR